jgi:hypothetical protein
VAGLAMTSDRRRRRSWDPVAAAAAAGAVLLVYQLLGTETKVIVWPDSINQLGPAVDALDRGTLTYWPNSGGFLYPLLLWRALAISPEPWTIVAVQRFLLVVTYYFLAAASWSVIHHTRYERSWPAWVDAAVCGAWLASFVLYLPVIGLAHAVMPETLFGTAIAMLLFTITCLTIRPLEARSGLLVAAVMLLLNVAATIVKPHWLPAAVASSVALILLANRGQRRRLLGGLTLGLALASVCLMWPESRWERQDATGFTRVFGPRTLFCNSADLMHDYLASRGDDLSTQVREDLQQMLTPAARQQAAAEGWGMMGFNGDACTHGDAARRIAAQHAGQPGAEAGYYLGSYFSALASNPAYPIARLVRQLAALAVKPFMATQGGYFLLVQPDALIESRQVRPLFDTWITRYPHLFAGEIAPPMRAWMLPLRVFFAVMGLLLTTATLLAAVVVIARLWRSRPLRPIERAFVVVASATLAINALIAVAHLFEPRYVVMQTPLFAYLGLLATMVVLVEADEWRRRRPSRAAAA